MRYLIVAYDFPPIPSPQALRWAYLANELARAGHEVHVLAPDTTGYGAGGLPQPLAGIVVHRVWPGPIAALMRSRRRRAKVIPASHTSPADASSVPATPSTLNWKGRLAERLKRIVSWFLFPDIRSEWLPWARHALRRVLATYNPDIVITSHEPANTIYLGLDAKRLGRHWISDLGDPVLAPYTPWRWRRRAGNLERRMCELADAVVVTNAKAAEQLQGRHDLPMGRIMVLPQGYDDCFEPTAGDMVDGLFRDDRLELLYTGSFYAFRRANALFDAVIAVPGVRLSVASMKVPDDVLRAAERAPESIRLLGFAPHRRVLVLQRQCDVLVNLANQDSVQIPGKLFEYLGANAPILNIDRSLDSAVIQLLAETGAGKSVQDDPQLIASELRVLLEKKLLFGRVERTRGDGSEAAYTWSRLAGRLAELGERLVTRDRAVPAPTIN